MGELGQWKERGLKSITQHLRVHIRDGQVPDPRGNVCWDHRKAEIKERWKKDSCSSHSEGEAPTSPLQSSLLFSAAFLIPASSSGASGVNPIRSNLGGSSRVSPNLSQHPEGGKAGAGCAPPGHWILSPHPSHPPKGSPKALTRRA